MRQQTEIKHMTKQVDHIFTEECCKASKFSSLHASLLLWCCAARIYIRGESSDPQTGLVIFPSSHLLPTHHTHTQHSGTLSLSAMPSPLFSKFCSSPTSVTIIYCVVFPRPSRLSVFTGVTTRRVKAGAWPGVCPSVALFELLFQRSCIFTVRFLRTAPYLCMRAAEEDASTCRQQKRDSTI